MGGEQVTVILFFFFFYNLNTGKKEAKFNFCSLCRFLVIYFFSFHVSTVLRVAWKLVISAGGNWKNP